MNLKYFLVTEIQGSVFIFISKKSIAINIYIYIYIHYILPNLDTIIFGGFYWPKILDEIETQRIAICENDRKRNA